MKTLKLCFISSAIMFLSISLVAQPKPWVVPANFKSKVNPVAKGAASNTAGMALYTKNCASCHGKTGLGDGPKGRMLKTHPGNFSTPEFQASTDGELFYRTKAGRGEMPAYDNKIPDNEIWAMVHHMRSFKK